MPPIPSPSATPSSGTHPLAPASSLDPSYAINILANAATADHPSSQAPVRTQSQKSKAATTGTVPAGDGGDASDPESDVELVSQIHPDLLMQHQNQLSMQHQATQDGEAGVTGGETNVASPESACLWSGCGKMFGRLEELVSHIHKEHVGTSKSTYKCMWEGCQLYGVTRTSRFALIGHIRSHTGERPFTCKLPECDKSFTRSDALTKHMRVVHNIEPIAGHAGGSKPSGGAAGSGNKKRKRGAKMDEDSDMDGDVPIPGLDSDEDDDADAGLGGMGTEDDTWNPYSGKRRLRAARKSKGGETAGVKKEEFTPSIRAPRDYSEDEDDEADYVFSYADLEPETGNVKGMGCKPPKARYMIVKAKYRYALGEHERLLEKLQFELDEVLRLKEEKDEALNQLLRAQFGAEAAEQLITPISGPPNKSAVAAR